MQPKLWYSERLYLDTDIYLEDLIRDIEKAQASVDLEVFIFEEGTFAQKLLETFAKLRARGIRIRLICDGWGSPLFGFKLLPQMRKLGIQVKVFRPLPWRFLRTRGEPLGFWKKLFLRFLHINRGFHRKVCLIDEKIAWVSSINVSDVHLSSVYGKNAWSDIAARLVGPESSLIHQAFEKAFYSRQKLRLKPRSRGELVHLNDSFWLRRKTTFMQKRRLKRAQNRIWIQNPYFIPERGLMRALYRRARRGVDVRVTLPERTDQPIVRWMSYALFAKLLKNGVRIFEYQPRFPHKKVLIVDNLTTIGSTNFNHRSFFHDLEIEVLITDELNKESLEKQFLRDQADSRELTLNSLQKRSIFFRIFTRIMFFFRYFC